MSIDQSLTAATLSGVVDPELRRSLGELGMLSSVQVKRKRMSVGLLLPVAQYPHLNELIAQVKRAGSGVAGVEEVAVTTEVMGEEARARLRMLLRGEPVPSGTGNQPEPHDHGGALGHEEGRPNRFMDPRSKTRILGISSGKGESASLR